MSESFFDQSISSEASFGEATSPMISPQNERRQRPSRYWQHAVPARLREVNATVDELEEVQMDLTAPLVMKCAQTSKLHNIKSRYLDLSRSDNTKPLTMKDSESGSSLTIDIEGKSYPVMFMYCRKGKGQKRSQENTAKRVVTTARKRQLEEGEEDAGQLQGSTSVPQLLGKEKVVKNQPEQPVKKSKVDHDGTLTILGSRDKDLIVDLARKVENLERTVVKLVEALKKTEVKFRNTDGSGTPSIKEKDDVCMVDNVNVLRLPSRDAYSYALQLLDIFFSKEELHASLLFKSKKSDKPGLDPRRVEKMMRLIEKRYGNDWDIRTLTSKVNQKCRDKKKH